MHFRHVEGSIPLLHPIGVSALRESDPNDHALLRLQRLIQGKQGGPIRRIDCHFIKSVIDGDIYGEIVRRNIIGTPIFHLKWIE